MLLKRPCSNLLLLEPATVNDQDVILILEYYFVTKNRPNQFFFLTVVLSSLTQNRLLSCFWEDMEEISFTK